MANDRARIVRAVRKPLQAHRLDGISINVLEDGVRKDTDWWYVPVQPSEIPTRVSPHYDVLATVEEEVDRDDNLNVLLAPTLPQE